MEIKECFEYVIKKFPFENYINSNNEIYFDVPRKVQHYLKVGDKILDFGAGPCDKTAILQMLGFKCSACDDLQDQWHKIAENRNKIIGFVKEFGIDLRTEKCNELSYEKNSFNMLIMLDVLEHLHDSPRELVNELLEFVKPGGYLVVTVPNLVNIKKRIKVLLGKSNLPDFEYFYWYPGQWRGHSREYTKDDLVKFSKCLGLEILELQGCNHMVWKLPKMLKMGYCILTSIFPDWRDSWLLIARKDENWKPKKISQEELIKYTKPF